MSRRTGHAILWLASLCLSAVALADETGSLRSPSTIVPVCEPAARSAVGASAGPKRLPRLFGKLTQSRHSDMIGDWTLDAVAPDAPVAGRGGITTSDRGLISAFDLCSDYPDGRAPEPGKQWLDAPTGLVVSMVSARPAGTSGRGWPGFQCSFRFHDVADPTLFVDLRPEDVPPFNTITGIVRQGSALYVSLQFNGYAREIKRNGNRVVALDLCRHSREWVSASLVSNAAMLLWGDYLITGYGFTAEPDYLFALDRHTGKVVQRVKVATGPSELRVQDGVLYVRLYDGYAAVRLLR